MAAGLAVWDLPTHHAAVCAREKVHWLHRWLRLHSWSWWSLWRWRRQHQQRAAKSCMVRPLGADRQRALFLRHVACSVAIGSQARNAAYRACVDNGQLASLCGQQCLPVVGFTQLQIGDVEERDSVTYHAAMRVWGGCSGMSQALVCTVATAMARWLLAGPPHFCRVLACCATPLPLRLLACLSSGRLA